MAILKEVINDFSGALTLDRFYSDDSYYIYLKNAGELVLQGEFVYPTGLYTENDFYEITEQYLPSEPTELEQLMSLGSGISSAGTARFGAVAGRISLKKGLGEPITTVKYFDAYNIEISPEDLDIKQVTDQRIILDDVSNQHFFEIFLFWPEQIEQYPELVLEITIKYDGQEKVRFLDVPTIIESNTDPDLAGYLYTPGSKFY